MGFKQTATHRFGKGSYHQIGLVRGQFGNVPEAGWIKFIADTGFDGWEEASWELDLRQCDTDAGAAAYAKERVDLAKKHGLEIFTVATHLQGQALGDEPSAKTLQFVGRARHGRPTRPGATRATSRRAPIPTSCPTKSASSCTRRRPATCSPACASPAT